MIHKYQHTYTQTTTHRQDPPPSHTQQIPLIRMPSQAHPRQETVLLFEFFIPTGNDVIRMHAVEHAMRCDEVISIYCDLHRAIL